MLSSGVIGNHRVRLKGGEVRVAVGDQVQTGDALIVFDLDMVAITALIRTFDLKVAGDEAKLSEEHIADVSYEPAGTEPKLRDPQAPAVV